MEFSLGRVGRGSSGDARKNAFFLRRTSPTWMVYCMPFCLWNSSLTAIWALHSLVCLFACLHKLYVSRFSWSIMTAKNPYLDLIPASKYVWSFKKYWKQSEASYSHPCPEPCPSRCDKSWCPRQPCRCSMWSGSPTSKGLENNWR